MNDSWDFHVLVRKKKLNRRDASVGNKLKMGKNSKRYQSSQVCNYNIILNKLATLLQSLKNLKSFLRLVQTIVIVAVGEMNSKYILLLY